MLPSLICLKIRMPGKPSVCVTEAGRRAVLLPGDIGESFGASGRGASSRLTLLAPLISLSITPPSSVPTKNSRTSLMMSSRRLIRVNVFAMFRLCKAILPQMKEGGSIINTGSSNRLIRVRTSLPTLRQKRLSLASLGHWPVTRLSEAFASMPWRRVRSGLRLFLPRCPRRR